MQSINIIESPWLKKIFLLLCQELKESDISACTMICSQIEKVYEDYLKQLEEEMAVCILFSFSGKILIIL